jgi:cohesin loading factor subunit SCC2
MMHLSQWRCTGFLFRAQPTLMTLERSATIMDAIFTSQEEEGRGRLLKILQDFLVSEASKHATKEKGSVFGIFLLPGSYKHWLDERKGTNKSSDVNMDELVGNTDGFADSGYPNLPLGTIIDLTFH